VARITRKELKSDKFALEVEQTVTFFEEHRKEIVRYGAIAIAVVLLVIGYMAYARHQRGIREDALARALQVQGAPVGPPSEGVNRTFPTQDAKDQVAIKEFSDVAARFGGSAEGDIAEYYLAGIKADQGKLAEAEVLYKKVADGGDSRYASLAKMSLAQIYFSDGRTDQGEKILRDLMDSPTIFVSKEQATLALARAIGPKKPAEARKLLDPYRSQRGAIGQTALQILAELPPQ
jgi:predicted negative regulator of RcsB-dependent stress response